jgi:phosphoribosylamine-glycine ligase
MGVVLLLAAPPFPYAKKLKEMSPKGLTVYLDASLEELDLEHVYFEGVAARVRKGKREYYVADEQGYIAYVTALEPTVEEARAKTEALAKRVHFPRMFYRNDVGVEFIRSTRERLRGWGYI